MLDFIKDNFDLTTFKFKIKNNLNTNKMIKNYPDINI